MERTWLITGCSSGLGKGIAKAVLARGDRAALTGMRERGGGWICNVTSIGGVRGALGNGYYSAAKAALERASEALAQEVAAFGIRVMLVEPGAFRRDCRDMVQKLAAQYPAAQIWVGTITVGKPSQGPWYLDPATLEDRAAYNDVLRHGTHPNRAGMVTFADGWYQAMAGTVPTKG